jgi:hypothetical protein
MFRDSFRDTLNPARRLDDSPSLVLGLVGLQFWAGETTANGAEVLCLCAHSMRQRMPACPAGRQPNAIK